MNYLKSCYNTAKIKGEGTNGIFTKSEEEDLACSAYSLYNTGSAYFRYRMTYSEAKLDYANTSYAKYIDEYYNGLRDKNGYDLRDIHLKKL